MQTTEYSEKLSDPSSPQGKTIFQIKASQGLMSHLIFQPRLFFPLNGPVSKLYIIELFLATMRTGSIHTNIPNH